MTDPRWQVVITPRAERELKALPPDEQRRVRRAIDGLAAFPNSGDLKKLRGTRNEWRLRVGEWRVRFGLDRARRTVVVLHVLPRGSAYR